MRSEPAEISRVLRPRAKARANYDRLSRWYDWVSAPFERAARERGLKLLGVAPGETVLEIGCGTGWGLLALAESVGSQGRVYGIDVSPGMLKVSRKRCAEFRWVELIRGDAITLPLETGRIDALFLSFALELFDTPEIPVVLRECQRVLREEGRVSVVSLSKSQNPGTPERFYERLHSAFPVTFDCRPILVEPSLTANGFKVVAERAGDLWSLPVAIVLATRTNLL